MAPLPDVREPADTSAAAETAVASEAVEAARLRVAQEALIETLADAIYARQRSHHQ